MFLADCVSRIANLFLQLVRYFEQQIEARQLYVLSAEKAYLKKIICELWKMQLQSYLGLTFKNICLIAQCMHFLPQSKISNAKKIIYNYIVAVGSALERQFPVMDLIINNTAF